MANMKQKILFYDNLYLGCDMEKDMKRIQKKMKNKKIQLGVFAITLPIFGEGLLEIYKSQEFLQKLYDEKEILVAGLAANENEAKELACKIVSDCYFKTGCFEVKKYLDERQECLL